MENKETKENIKGIIDTITKIILKYKIGFIIGIIWGIVGIILLSFSYTICDITFIEALLYFKGHIITKILTFPALIILGSLHSLSIETCHTSGFNSVIVGYGFILITILFGAIMSILIHSGIRKTYKFTRGAIK